MKNFKIINLLQESPDMVYTKNKTFHYRADDAIPFGYYKGKLYIGGAGSIHPHIYVPAFKDNPIIQGTRNFKHDRTFFKLAGRIWLDSGIISFWDYPTVPELKQLLFDFDKAMLDEFGKETNFHNNMGNMWIELVSESDAKEINYDYVDIWGGQDGSEESSKLIPLLKYNGSGVWGDEERNRSHTEVGSGGKEVPAGFGSRKELPGDGNSNAERRFKMGESLVENENAVHNLKVYHGTNTDFRRLSLKYSYQGILWFTDNINKIKNNEHGGRGNTIILTGNLTLENPAGWDEYEKYGIGQLKGLGHDGVILSDGDGFNDYIVFNPKSVKNVKKIKLDENDINESPDTIEKLDVSFRDKDAIPFGYYNDNLYIGNFGRTHGDIKIPYYDKEDVGIGRKTFKFPGRIWVTNKIISFWEYPSKAELFKILNDLTSLINNTYNININPNDIVIECVPPHQERRVNGFAWNADSIFVSPQDYQGGSVWDPDIKAKEHVKIGAGGENVVSGFGSRIKTDTSNTKSGTEAERRFKMGEIFNIK